MREEKTMEEDLVEYAARDRDKLNQAGFPVHNEQRGIGMQEGLGLSIGEDLRLTVTAEKMKKLVLSTEALAMHPRASPRVLARLIGQWTWAMMLHRCALALFHQAFRFLQAYDQWDTPRRLWKSVQNELWAVSCLSVFFCSELGASWWEKVYMADAAPLDMGWSGRRPMWKRSARRPDGQTTNLGLPGQSGGTRRPRRTVRAKGTRRRRSGLLRCRPGCLASWSSSRGAPGCARLCAPSW